MTWDSLAQLPLLQAIADSIAAFAAVESLHIVFIAVLGGVVLVGGLAGAGLAPAGLAPLQLTHGLRWPYRGALIGAAITGALLFGTAPQKYLSNPLFIAKLLLLSAALVAYALLRRDFVRGARGRRINAWAIASLVLWFATITAGRWIGLI